MRGAFGGPASALREYKSERERKRDSLEEAAAEEGARAAARGIRAYTHHELSAAAMRERAREREKHTHMHRHRLRRAAHTESVEQQRRVAALGGDYRP